MDADYALFALIVSTGSLSAAGRSLGQSPAMVSKRLARLETRLGVTLLHRTTRRIALTEPGARFHADIVEILGSLAAAEARLSGERNVPSGALRVSAPTSFGRLHIAPYLDRFLDAHPRIDLELDLSDSFADLLTDRTDLAVRITSAVPPGLVARRLTTSRRILCASPAYLATHGAPDSLPSLKQHRLLAASGQMPWRLTSAKGTALTVEGISHVRTNSSEVVRELAIAGVGIALRSLWDVSEQLTQGRLVQVLPAYEGPADVGIYAITPRLPWPSANADAFAAFLTDLYAPVAPWER